MSDDLNTEIKIGADASGVEAGVGKAKRSLKSLGDAAQQAGKDAGAGMGAIGAGGDKSAKDVERATRTMQNSIQRLIAEQKAGAKGSREYWEALANTRGVNTAALRPLLDQLDAAKSATNAAKGAAESWRDSLGKIGPMVAAAFSGAALAGFIGKVVSVQREFDVLNSSLKTVTGSSAAAEREMAWLKDFAKETPFGLAQATQGFVKMKALGLDPTRAALTSFGNTASAMGKDLNQMIEAVADASTGEFERLKEFGIKAKKEGDNVSLTFQGVTTTIRNSAADITKYLEDIGNTSFGGAMEERAKTLDGTIAALGDTWDELFRTVSTNNVGSLIFDSVTLANGALEDATTILRALGGAAQDAGRDTGALSTIQNGIATVFETVAVLGANLKFVLVGIGNEIGGLAAQVAQAAQFNFAGVRAIREQMIADAEAARREVDATTARILNARKAQEEYARYATRNASAATDPRRVDLGGSTTRKPVAGVDSKGINAANKELADQAKLIAELNGLTGSFAKEWDTLSAVYAKGGMSLEQLTSAQAALLAKQPAIKAFADEQVKAQQVIAKANLDAAASREKYLTSLSTGLDKIQADIAAQIEATERMGLSKEAIAELDAAKLEMLATDLELQAIKAMDRNLDQQTYDALKAQAQAYRELGIAKKGGAAKEAALDLEKANSEAAKKAQEDWERAAEQINSTLTDALMRGFESGKDFAKNLRDTVVNMFKTMVLRPVVSAIVNPISQGITGMMGLSGAAQAGQGGGNAASTAMSAASLFGAGGFGGALAAGAGWVTGATTLGGALSAGTSLIGAGAAGVLPGLGMIAGALGPIALGIAAISSLFSRKLKDTGIEGTLGGDAGFEGQQYKFYKGGLLRSDKTTYSAIDPKLDSGLDAAVRQMQQSMLGLANSFDLPTEAITGFTQSIKLSFKGLDEAGIQAKIQEALTGYNEALASAFIESMENSEVPAWVDRLIGNTDASAVQRLQEVAEWPARMLQQFGTSRDDMVRMFTEGLASGDAMAAGQSVADTLVASIQNAVFTNAAGQIFDIVNQGIVTPMLDAIATGASVSEALSQATIDKTIERATEQAKALGALFGNAEFAAALEQLRTAVGGALGQAGGYLQTVPQALSVIAPTGTGTTAADPLQKYYDDRKSLEIELATVMGDTGKAYELITAGMSTAEKAAYDFNEGLRDQITELERMAEVSRTLASELPAVLDKFRTPEQRTDATYARIAGDLGAAGINVGADTLANATKDQIAAAVVQLYNLGTTSDETRLALVRAASGLADLKDAAEAAAEAAREEARRRREAAQGIVDGTRGSLDNLVKSLTEGASKASGGAIGRLSVTGAEYEQFQGFAQQLDGATQALKELEKLGLGDELKGYADQIGAIVRETETLLAGQLSSARLTQGDAEGALAALRAMSDLTHDQFATAGAYNTARAQEDARNARSLYAQASANALTTVNVGAVLGTLADVLNSEELWRPVAVEIASGIAQGNLLVRDAVADAAGVLARNGLPTIGGSGIAAVHAEQAKLASASAGGWARGSWQMGEDVVAYGQALDRLDGMLKTGKLSAQEHAGAIGALNTAMGSAADLLGDTAAQAERLAAAQQAVGDAGLQSIGYYFGQYGQMADKLAETARQSATALGQTTDAIGRLNSASSVFGQSAGAAASWDDYAGNSSIGKARLVADSAKTAAAAMTTADAERAAAALAKTGVFANVRDAALMLDGIGQYDSKGFEDAFTRIGAALGRGQIGEAEYKALFDTALELYKTGTTSAAEAARNLTSSFERLRDVMGDFADGLLIGDKTTLGAGQTLAEIQRQYTEALIGSTNGDTDAMGKYTELANTLLDKNLYANQAEYNAAFGRVYGDARQLESVGVNTLAAQQGGNVVAEIKAMNGQLSKRVEELDRNLTAALAQIAKNTSETSKGVDRMNTVGLPA